MRLLHFTFAIALTAQQFPTPVTVLPGPGSSTGAIRLRERGNEPGQNYTGFQAPQILAADVMYELPSQDGTLGQALVTNGGAKLSWGSVAGNTIPVCASTTGSDTYACTVSGFTSYSAGYCIVLLPDTSNTGPATVNISAVGVRNILRYGGSSLVDGDISAGQPVMICDTGSEFTLPPSASPGSGAFLQGGNSFSAPAVLGTNDAYALNFETGGTTKWTIDTVGALFPAVDNVQHIGLPSYRVHTVYTHHVDAAPGGETGNYIRFRKAELVDNAGGTAAWDLQASASVTTSALTLRDNAGSRVLVPQRQVAGSAANEMLTFINLIPTARSTGGGDTVDDLLRPSLGNLLNRWTYGFINLTDTNAIIIRTGAVNNYVLTTDGSGNASWQVTQPCPACFINNGNSFGADATIGTNDAYALKFETSGSTRLTISATGMFTPGVHDAQDFGDPAVRFRTVYARAGEFLRSGGTSSSDYMSTRKVNVCDQLGGSGCWDIQSSAAVGVGSMRIRDNAGDPAWNLIRSNSPAANSAEVYMDIIPFRRDTADGHTVTDTNLPSLGRLNAPFFKIWGTDGDYAGNLTIHGTTVAATINYSGGVMTGTMTPLFGGTGSIGSVSYPYGNGYFSDLKARAIGLGVAAPASGTFHGSSDYNAMVFDSYDPLNSGVGGNVQFRFAGGTLGAPSAAPSGARLGSITFSGYGLTTYGNPGARLRAIAGSAFTDSSRETYIDIETTPAGAATSVARWRFAADGGLVPVTTNVYPVGGPSLRVSKVWATDIDISGTCTGCGSLPVVDSTAIVFDNSDSTKRLRLEVSGVTSGATRVWTAQDANITVAGLNYPQTFTEKQRFRFGSGGYDEPVTLVNSSNPSGSYLPACLVLASTDTVTLGSEIGAGRLCGGYNSPSFAAEIVEIQTATGSGSYQTAISWTNLATRIYGALTVDLTINATGNINSLNNISAGPLGLISGNTIDASGWSEADSFRVNGNTVIDASRNGYFVNGTFTGSVGAVNATLSGALIMGSTTVVNSSRNLVGLNTIGQTLLFTTDAVYDLGGVSSGRPNNGYFGGNVNVGGNFGLSGNMSFSGTMTPLFGGLGSLGSASYPYGVGYFSNLTSTTTLTANGGISTSSGSSSTVYVGSGNFYLRTYTGGDPSCSGVTTGWAGYRADTNELQICSSGTLKKVSLL